MAKGSLSMFFKPIKDGANTAGGQANARIRRAIIEVDGVTIGGNGGAARKDDLVHIPSPLVGFGFREDNNDANELASICGGRPRGMRARDLRRWVHRRVRRPGSRRRGSMRNAAQRH